VDNAARTGRRETASSRRYGGDVHAVIRNADGGPEVFEWAEVPDPAPGPGEVVIEVVAAGVNRADVQQRRGLYPPPPGAPDYLGLECSGRIFAVGADVTDWQLGDEVCALLPGGGYAERVAVSADTVLPVPAGVSLRDAAGLPEIACTVWSNLVQVGRLSAGETLLVHGGGSGIGTFAIQLARALGAVPYATARTVKHEALRALGVEEVFDYTTTDFVAALADATGGHGADVILDHIGAKYLTRNVTALARNGRLVVIGFQGGRTAELDLGLLMARNASLTVTGLRARPLPEKAAIVGAVRTHVWPLVTAGAIRPVIADTFPLPDAAEAHRVMESNSHLGKLLLTR
jgi:putative PIG3 family NAD(P)H quinone oxidoreductase